MNNNASDGVQHVLGNYPLYSSRSCYYHHHRPCVAACEGKPHHPAPRRRRGFVIVAGRGVHQKTKLPRQFHGHRIKPKGKEEHVIGD